MTKLKTILLSKYFYLCLILLTILYCLITLKLHFFKTNYNSNCKHIVGIITNIKKKKNFNILEIKCGESFLVYDYEKEKYSMGDTVKVFGHFKRIDGNSNFNLFNYRNKNGLFNNIEEIMNVAGIGDSIFDKIKDNITV